MREQVEEIQETRSVGSSTPATGTRPSAGPSAASARARGGGASETPTESVSDGFQSSGEEEETSFLHFGPRSWGRTASTEPAADPAGDPTGDWPSDQEPPVDAEGNPIPQGVTREAVRPPVRPANFAEEHKALDKDGDGKVTAGDMGLDEKAFGKLDANRDGKLSKEEYRADFHQRNSFQALDADGDGQLSAAEMQKLERFTSTGYDRDRNGSVDAEEFQAGRRAEMLAARRERIEERLAGLEGDDLKKKVERYDADGDGKVTADEVLAGRRAARDQARTGQAEQTFAAMAGDQGSFEVADHQRYGVYDQDGDGKVTAREFQAGQAADWETLRQDRYLDGARNPEERRRLGVDAAGQAVPGRNAAPVDVGDLRNLTFAQATALVKQQGGELFKNGQPTVLALRTENRGTTGYDDWFVVLKPNGEMKAFAATTRPGFTTPGGGWDPGMVVPGNYDLWPRPRDGKFNDDAFILGKSGGMSVPTAKDRNADGRYSQDEIADTVGDDCIRLHRGNATTTSSAGCFNVQDYDAFLAFLGGRDMRFNMTLVEI